MMNFDEFKKAVVDEIKDFLPEKYEDAQITIRDVVKNNDTIMPSLVIENPDSNMSPNIYLDSYFQQYENGRDLDAIIGDIADVYIENAVDHDFDLDRIVDLDNVKDKIMPRLVNAEMNQEVLSERPHVMMDDLAVTFAIEIGKDEMGTISVPISNQLMEHYDISSEELHEIAMANMNENMEITFTGISETVKETMIQDALTMTDGDREEAERLVGSMLPEKDVMFVLSNEEKMYGATAILSDKAMDMISEKVEGDFYVLPSSTHELLIVPKETGATLEDLEAMVQDVNANQVAPQERLSDHVYEYDAQEKELYRADHEAEHEQKKEQKREESKEEKPKEKTRVSMKEKMSEMKAKAEKENAPKEKAPVKKKEMEI